MNLFLKKDIKGTDNIPSEPPFIICANHVHLLDPIVVAISTKYKISFMAKKELFNSKLKNWFFKKLNAIPVSRDGNDSYSIKAALKVIKEKKVLAIFPEGTRSIDSMLEFKPGVSMLAIKTNTPLVPVFIHGGYKPFNRITVRIGKPIDLSEYSGKKLSSDEYSYIANHIIAEEIKKLREEI